MCIHYFVPAQEQILKTTANFVEISVLIHLMGRETTVKPNFTLSVLLGVLSQVCQHTQLQTIHTKHV